MADAVKVAHTWDESHYDWNPQSLHAKRTIDSGATAEVPASGSADAATLRPESLVVQQQSSSSSKGQVDVPKHPGAAISSAAPPGSPGIAGQQRAAIAADAPAKGLDSLQHDSLHAQPKGKVVKLVCQVENCHADLSTLKEYHQRYKICAAHLKHHSILENGRLQRFCQQCGRFHDLSEFDGDKRSCRARLQKHNARRRKKHSQEETSHGSAAKKQLLSVTPPMAEVLSPVSANGMPLSHVDASRVMTWVTTHPPPQPPAAITAANMALSLDQAIMELLQDRGRPALHSPAGTHPAVTLCRNQVPAVSRAPAQALRPRSAQAPYGNMDVVNSLAAAMKGSVQEKELAAQLLQQLSVKAQPPLSLPVFPAPPPPVPRQQVQSTDTLLLSALAQALSDAGEPCVPNTAARSSSLHTPTSMRDPDALLGPLHQGPPSQQPRGTPDAEPSATALQASFLRDVLSGSMQAPGKGLAMDHVPMQEVTLQEDIASLLQHTPSQPSTQTVARAHLVQSAPPRQPVNGILEAAVAQALRGGSTAVHEAVGMLQQSQQCNYVPEETLARIATKLYDATPADLPHDLKSQFVSMLACSPSSLEGAIKSGCVLLTLQARVPLSQACAPAGQHPLMHLLAADHLQAATHDMEPGSCNSVFRDDSAHLSRGLIPLSQCETRTATSKSDSGVPSSSDNNGSPSAAVSSGAPTSLWQNVSQQAVPVLLSAEQMVRRLTLDGGAPWSTQSWMLQSGSQVAYVDAGHPTHVLSLEGGAALLPCMLEVEPGVLLSDAPDTVTLLVSNFKASDRILCRRNGVYVPVRMIDRWQEQLEGEAVAAPPTAGTPNALHGAEQYVIKQRVDALEIQIGDAAVWDGCDTLPVGLYSIELCRGDVLSNVKHVLCVDDLEVMRDMRSCLDACQGEEQRQHVLVDVAHVLSCLPMLATQPVNKARPDSLLSSSDVQNVGRTAARLLAMAVPQGCRHLVKGLLAAVIAAADCIVGTLKGSKGCRALGVRSVPAWSRRIQEWLDEACAPGVTLLHLAVAARTEAACMVRTLAAWYANNGLSCSASCHGRQGLTPLHLAALLQDASVADALLKGDPHAAWSWCHAESDDRFTPAQLAKMAGFQAGPAVQQAMYACKLSTWSDTTSSRKSRQLVRSAVNRAVSSSGRETSPDGTASERTSTCGVSDAGSDGSGTFLRISQLQESSAPGQDARTAANMHLGQVSSTDGSQCGQCTQHLMLKQQRSLAPCGRTSAIPLLRNDSVEASCDVPACSRTLHASTTHPVVKHRKDDCQKAGSLNDKCQGPGAVCQPHTQSCSVCCRGPGQAYGGCHCVGPASFSHMVISFGLAFIMLTGISSLCIRECIDAMVV